MMQILLYHIAKWKSFLHINPSFTNKQKFWHISTYLLAKYLNSYCYCLFAGYDCENFIEMRSRVIEAVNINRFDTIYKHSFINNSLSNDVRFNSTEKFKMTISANAFCRSSFLVIRLIVEYHISKCAEQNSLSNGINCYVLVSNGNFFSCKRSDLYAKS